MVPPLHLAPLALLLLDALQHRRVHLLVAVEGLGLPRELLVVLGLVPNPGDLTHKLVRLVLGDQAGIGERPRVDDDKGGEVLLVLPHQHHLVDKLAPRQRLLHGARLDILSVAQHNGVLCPPRDDQLPRDAVKPPKVPGAEEPLPVKGLFGRVIPVVVSAGDLGALCPHYANLVVSLQRPCSLQPLTNRPGVLFSCLRVHDLDRGEGARHPAAAGNVPLHHAVAHGRARLGQPVTDNHALSNHFKEVVELGR
mmetsp:Transcript_34383/g.83698  ORF Transcript_34383/g.83698 Transcript_34383/m.83698 type:complete len:252 (+) Transcript_34383:208-963(+)